METETKTEGVADTTNSGVNSEANVNNETVSISKAEYDTLNQTLGSLKRELKDLKKVEKDPEKPQKTSKLSEAELANQRLEKLALRQANITHEDDIRLARETSKKWGVDIEDLILDPDFKSKLERQQSERDSIVATTNIRGNNSTSNAKNTADYWIAKGTPPTPADVPDRTTRQNIIGQMLSKKGSSKTFYND